MKKILLSLLLAAGTLFASAQYRNPIINADVPDVSLCNDGQYYYMISTTMHLMPGAPIMRSKDLQHWEVVSYVFDRINDGDRYDLKDNKTVYGQGQWASSLRYVNGKFWVWFTANGAPGKGFVYSADKAEGPWTLVARPPHFHDGSLFFDDNGKVYMFYGTGDLQELDPQTFQKKEGGLSIKTFERDADERGLLEGSSVIKRNGKYYLCMISMDWSIPGRLRREVCYRADNIEGPYTKKVILETAFESYGGVGQGCLVEGQAIEADAKPGEKKWYAVVFQDRGGIGRTPCLMPVTWTDEWPMLGTPGEGKIPNDLTVDHIQQSGVVTSDDFASEKMKLVWQWNHNPIDGAWSLSERKGYMRLKTARVVNNIFVAPNTLTQRMEGPKCCGVVKIDVANMADGDVCGFAAYNGDSGVLNIRRSGKKYSLSMSEEKSVFNHDKSIKESVVSDIETVDLTKVLKAAKGDKSVKGSKFVYLKINADFNPGCDNATFEYSLDGKSFKSIGHTHKMVFDYRRMFMGSKFAIFNYATSQLGGYVDVDSFDYSVVK